MMITATKSRAAALLVLLALTTTAYKCPSSPKTPSDIDAVENKLNQGANALNALAKTNRTLYQKNVINLQQRRTVAMVINRGNAGLDRVVDRVYLIDPNNPASIATGKIDVAKLLQDINSALGEINFGPVELRAAAQAVIAIINEALDLTNRIREIRPKAELHGPFRLTLPKREVYDGD